MKKLKLPILAFLLAMTAAVALHAKSKSMINYTWYYKSVGPSGHYTLQPYPSPNPPSECPSSGGDYICAKGFYTIIPPAVVTDLTVANMNVHREHP